MLRFSMAPPHLKYTQVPDGVAGECSLCGAKFAPEPSSRASPRKQRMNIRIQFYKHACEPIEEAPNDPPATVDRKAA